MAKRNKKKKIVLLDSNGKDNIVEPNSDCNSLACAYCEFFHTTNKHWEGGSLRECPKTKKPQRSSTVETNCEHFKLHRYIWCPVFKRRYFNSVCSGRNANVNPCVHCDIGYYVRDYIDKNPNISYEVRKYVPPVYTGSGRLTKKTITSTNQQPIRQPKEPIRKPKKNNATVYIPKRKLILISKRTSKTDGAVKVTKCQEN